MGARMTRKRESGLDWRSRYEQRIRDLAGLGHRGSATEQEQRAASYLLGELRGLGLEAQEETFLGSTSFGARLLLHVALAAVGAALLWWVPWATILLGAAALFSLTVEQTTRGRLLSGWLTRSLSRNVIARSTVQSPPRRRLLVSAHYDTQRTGLVWREVWMQRLASILMRSPEALRSPFLPTTLAIAVQPLLGVAALLRVAPALVSALTAVILLVYGVTGILLADWGRGVHVPGASDNASGVAAALELAERWLGDPVDGVELVLLFTGCEETGLLGAAAWADAHRDEIRTLPTLFLNLDGLGFGPPRFLSAELPVAGLPVPYPTDLVHLCRRTAHEQGLVDAGPHTVYGPTDGLAFLIRGIPGITVIGFRNRGHLPNYHQVTDTPDRVDFEAAWCGIEFASALLRHLAEPA